MVLGVVMLSPIPVFSGIAAAKGKKTPAPTSAVVRVELKVGSASLEHPGYRVQYDEPAVLTIRQDATKHELDVTVHRVVQKDAERYDVNLRYRRNGKAVLSKSFSARPREKAQIGGGRAQIVLVIDPNGKTPDELAIEDTDDPIAGLE
jgi:hypothetical protein